MLNRRKIWVPEPNVAQLVSDQFDDVLTSPTQVLVHTHYSHISAGTELACIAGEESFFTIPDTPGYTAVGEIMKKGSAVENLEEGDLVYTYGPHAEYFIIDLEDRWHGVCVKLPEGIDPALASFTHMAGIAMTSLAELQGGTWGSCAGDRPGSHWHPCSTAGAASGRSGACFRCGRQPAGYCRKMRD